MISIPRFAEAYCNVAGAAELVLQRLPQKVAGRDNLIALINYHGDVIHVIEDGAPRDPRPDDAFTAEDDLLNLAEEDVEYPHEDPVIYERGVGMLRYHGLTV